MSVNLEVRISERTGLPYTSVPSEVMWELAEYLALQRADVLYGYTADGFTVTFQRMGQGSAQRLLDAWSAARMSDYACQEAASDPAGELCYIPG